MNENMLIAENKEIKLVQYTHDDDYDMYECWKDIDTQKGYNFIFNETLEEFVQFDIEEFQFWATIVDKKRNIKVGTLRLGLDEICPDLAIWIYPKYRNAGYGTQAFKLALKYIFENFNYSEISAGCYIDNTSSIKMLDGIGFIRYSYINVKEINCFTGESTEQLELRISKDKFILGGDKMITIKNLTVEDMKEAIQLKVNCWTEELAGKAENTLNYSKELEFWVDWMSSAEENEDVRLLIGAFEDNKMLGVAFASFAETEDISEKGIELNGLWVYPEQRGKGVSLRLISYIIDSFKSMGMEQMVIYNHHYCPSNNFYRKFGANVIKQHEQMSGKLLVDVFLADIDEFKNNIEKSLLK